MAKIENIRNIAIIAHVDHGKTTLVDELLKQSGVFRDNQHVSERIMDSNDLEKERGITIFSKNTAINYNGTKINIIDTPGHADFGGEVERVLKMVDGVLLLVDAFEGPMPQTRFVLKKAMKLNLVPIVVINKVDRPDARAEAVYDEILDLFISLQIEDHQLDFPIIFTSAKEGYAIEKLTDKPVSVKPLLDAIVNNIPAPEGDIDGPFQCLVSSIDYDKYVGRIGVGRISRGSVSKNDEIMLCKKDGELIQSKVVSLYTFDGLKRKETEKAGLGDIIAVSGIEGIHIGDSICDVDSPDPVDFVDIDEPTISMIFSVNNSPLAGTEGKFVTSRHLRNRLFRELESNVSLHIEETGSMDSFKVLGRGELHLSILIETMRREGYEFQVSRPAVVIKDVDGVKHEPVEYLIIDVPEEFVGTVIKKVGARKGEMVSMEHGVQGSTRLEFRIPAKNLIGYYSEMLTDTKGTGILNHTFDAFEPLSPELLKRPRGSMIAFESGESTIYGLFNAQKRGTLFIDARVKVYTGMIVGENAKSEDLNINVCKLKQLTNVRASGSDEALRLINIRYLSLEQALEFISDDELVEVTPVNIRMRKKELNPNIRERAKKV
ncbi:MAG: translational GTPase TypA [Clostridia bacterium]|nr:translational GTPase TypA [Clostridia bacterium]MBN2882186.1 translational GTPase TypA [Clostridia bacterium]